MKSKIGIIEMRKRTFGLLLAAACFAGGDIAKGQDFPGTNLAWWESGRAESFGLAGVTKDEANQIYRSALEGNPRDQFYLGLLFLDGVHLPKIHLEALKYFQSSAEKGDPYAQYMMGWVQTNDFSSENKPAWNEEEYSKWFGLAFNFFLQDAKKGNPGSQFIVGKMYLRSIAFPLDFNTPGFNREEYFDRARRDRLPEAEKWFLKAAMLGHAWSMGELSILLREGSFGYDSTEPRWIIVDEERTTECYAWSLLASASGYPLQRLPDFRSLFLTPNLINAGEKIKLLGQARAVQLYKEIEGIHLPERHLTIYKTENGLEVSWTGGLLQTSSSVDGPWVNVNTASPFQIVHNPLVPSAFFRLKP